MKISDLVKVNFTYGETISAALIIDIKDRPWDEVPSVLILFKEEQRWVFKREIEVINDK